MQFVCGADGCAFDAEQAASAMRRNWGINMRVLSCDDATCTFDRVWYADTESRFDLNGLDTCDLKKNVCCFEKRGCKSMDDILS